MIDERQLVEWRRAFHAIPEVGFTEYQTTAKIVETLNTLGYRVLLGREILSEDERMGLPSPEVDQAAFERAREAGVDPALLAAMKDGFTGAVGILENGEGPTIGCRFDIDCVEVQEELSSGHLPYEEHFHSEHPGLMHACGHDGHIAIGLGLAKWLVEHTNRWSGRVKLIFQPAEEGVKGAVSMVDAGVVDDCAYFLAGHVGIYSGEDTLFANVGDFLSTSKFDVLYRGKSVHAGMSPNRGRNALLAAATAALQLHAIPRHGEGATRINVGKLQAGSGRNVIADEGKLVLETRGSTAELNEYMVQEMYRVVEGVASIYDVTCHVERMGAATRANSSEELAKIAASLGDKAGFSRVIDRADTLGGSEDASFMMKRVEDRGGKALYMVFATALEADHHNRSFDFDERVLKKAVRVFAGIIERITP